MDPSTTIAATCPTCTDHPLEPFFRLASVPVFCHVFTGSAIESTRVPRADIELGLCTGCGAIVNFAFDPSLVANAHEFENSGHFSQKFRTYARGLTQMLARNHALDGKDVVEIGCGKGDFLAQLASRTTARCVGFDRRYGDEQDFRDLPNLCFVKHEFSPHDYPECRADLVILRHVLEHVHEPHAFLSDVRRILDDGANFFVEVPNTLFQLREHRIWDIIYERCAYWSAPSLRRALRRVGLEPTNIHASFGGRFLCAEGHAGPARDVADHDPALAEVATLARGLARSFERSIREWNDRIARRLQDGERIAVWGAGSKGVSFLNLVPNCAGIATVVDLNERKHGKFVPGTSHRIVSPEELGDLAIDTILVMNSHYTDEITAQIRDLALHCELVEV
ncbi:MAG: methyltransferase domain-containing protein [Planctomycetes bacterium]|nr:methyltransferase domain-containing protein [Planctomycetota bacterium]